MPISYPNGVRSWEEVLEDGVAEVALWRRPQQATTSVTTKEIESEPFFFLCCSSLCTASTFLRPFLPLLDHRLYL